MSQSIERFAATNDKHCEAALNSYSTVNRVDVQSQIDRNASNGTRKAPIKLNLQIDSSRQGPMARFDLLQSTRRSVRLVIFSLILHTRVSSTHESLTPNTGKSFI